MRSVGLKVECNIAWLGLLMLLPAPTASSRAQEPIQLRDVSQETGITFCHTDGSSGIRYIIESMTGGVALLDYDQDGDLDIYFLNGAPLQGTVTADRPTNALYRNEGEWRFRDVTREAGVGDLGYGLGVTSGDFDNDGYPDLYVNNFGANVLYHNSGDGTFEDWTVTAEIANGHRVGAGVCFLDLEADGDLDLFVGNYVQFSYELHKPHVLQGLPSYPSPLNYQPDPDTVYRSNGDGTFADVSVASGVARHAGTSMGIVCADYDNDGDTDVFVGNDVKSNFLYENDGRGNFSEVALQSGTALDIGGMPHGSMGVSAADFDNDGQVDFHVTSYAGEFATLYHNLGGGLFEDVTRVARAGAATLPHVTWGNGFADFDNDGHRDLFIACGHLDDNIEQRKDTTSYRLPNILLRNLGRGAFEDVSQRAGDGMRVVESTRGMALGDLDNDGDVDVILLNSRRPPTLLRNDSPPRHHWLAVRLVGTHANRDGVGAQVRVVAGDLTQTEEVHSGCGYQSDSGPRLGFGLADQSRVDRLEIRWPGGQTELIEGLEADQYVTLVQRPPK